MLQVEWTDDEKRWYNSRQAAKCEHSFYAVHAASFWVRDKTKNTKLVLSKLKT